MLAGYECVFLVVSSHGHERRYSSDTDIRCSDGKFISLYAIVDYFNNRKLPNFTDLPKVFIFQACRSLSFYIRGPRPPARSIARQTVAES